jgi:hypothetical protein
MIEYIVRAFDYAIYRLSFHSLRRMAKRNHGTAVVLQLWLNDYLKAYPVCEEQQVLAAIYYEQHFKNHVRT